METTSSSRIRATLRTSLLMAALTGLLLGIGFLIGGPETALIFLLISLLINAISFFWSDKMALSMSRARPMSEAEHGQIYEMTRELADRAQIPMPRLYSIPQQQANAFATGRSPKRGAVALTEGIMRDLPREELRGVIAHEIAHIKHRDILVQSVAAAIAGAITYIGYMIIWGSNNNSSFGIFGSLAMVILAPIAASLIQLAVSRQREYAADARGAALCGNPESLASALLRLDKSSQQTPMTGHVSQATEPLYIIKPFRSSGLAALFSTHPPTAERVARLREMRPTLG